MIPATPEAPMGLQPNFHGSHEFLFWTILLFFALFALSVCYRWRKRGMLVFAGLLLLISGLGMAPIAIAQAAHGINWTWAAVTTDTAGNSITVSGYNIYCATAGAGPFTAKTNSALLTSPAFQQTGLAVGTTYFCQATAVFGTAESAHSATSAGVLFQFPPAAPPAAPAGQLF